MTPAPMAGVDPLVILAAPLLPLCGCEEPTAEEAVAGGIRRRCWGCGATDYLTREVARHTV